MLQRRDIRAFVEGREVEPAQLFLLRLRAEELTRRHPTSGYDGMESLESSSDTILYPHQIHASHFSVSNPLLKGVLLADEVGLGKTVEAAMIIKEMAYRGKRNILVMASRSLCQQWVGELQTRFGLTFPILDAGTVRRMRRGAEPPYAGLRIATYHFVNTHIGEIAKTPWDLIVVDECHTLKNPQGALHGSLKRIPRAFTLLLTATPIQNYLTELHAISALIDDQLLGTPFSFRERYCGDDRGLRVQNVEELKERLARFAIRTLRGDVPEIKFTERIPKLFNFDLFPDEQQLYESVSGYLSRPNWAFGDNAAGKYLIVMVYRKLLASSSFALREALRKVAERLEAIAAGKKVRPLRVSDLGSEARESAREIAEEVPPEVAEQQEAVRKSIRDELEEVQGYLRLCDSIKENAKGIRLVSAMLELMQAGDKVLVFTQYKATQHYLARKLRDAGYTVVEFSGDLKGHPNPDKDEREQAKRQFRNQAQVMIATDAGAEGLNLQFCHIVVNYDLPWNPMKIEQRIGRCHRIGQQYDVVVANLVALGNAVDARLVQLLTDKIHLFDSVLGESDEILGALEEGIDFERAVFGILQTCRSPEDIDAAFDGLQREMEHVILDRRARGRSLLQGFDDRLRDHLRLAETAARAALDRRTRQLRDFLLGSLELYGANVEESDGVYRVVTPAQYFLQSAELVDPEYTGTFTKSRSDGVSLLNKRHPLITTALAVHMDLGHRAAVVLEYTGKHTIHGLEQLVGSTGWWLNFTVSFTGFETEDHIISVALVRDGDRLSVHPLLSDNLARITVSNGQWREDLPFPRTEVVTEWLSGAVELLRSAILERNAQYYVERRAVIDRFYGAKGDGEVLAELRHRVHEKLESVAQLEQVIDRARTMVEKSEMLRQKDRLEEELFGLQRRMQTEQMTNYEVKRHELEQLEQLRQLEHTVDLVSVGQWTMR